MTVEGKFCENSRPRRGVGYQERQKQRYDRERGTRNKDTNERMELGRWEGTVGRTGFSREDVLIVKEVLHPCHHVVDIGGRGKLHALAVLVDPRVVEASGERGRVRRMSGSMRSASLRTRTRRPWSGTIAPCSIQRERHKIGSGSGRSRRLNP